MLNLFIYLKNFLINKKQMLPFFFFSEDIFFDKNNIRLISKSILCLNEKNNNCFLKDLCFSCYIYNKYNHPDYLECNLTNDLTLNKINIKKIENFVCFENIASKKKIIFLNFFEEIELKIINLYFKIFKSPPKNILFLVNLNGFRIYNLFLEFCYILKLSKIESVKKISFDVSSYNFLKFLFSFKNDYIFYYLNNKNILNVFNLIFCVLIFLFKKKSCFYIKNLIFVLTSFKKLINKNPILNKNLMVLFIKKHINQLILFSSL